MIIYLGLVPKNLELSVYSNLDSLNDDSLEHGRVISFSGKPEYSGTYLYTDIDLNKAGQDITLPACISVIIQETNSNPEIIGQLTYLVKYSDNELGINEPDHFSAEIYYSERLFEKAWELVGKLNIGILRVTVAIKAPKTDISGHEAILDVEESNSWPIEALYLKRHDKLT